MIGELKPYADYKKTGLPWITSVPAHWKLLPNRALIRKRKELVGKNHSKYRLLSLTKAGVIVRDVTSGKGKWSSDMGTSQEVRAGDFVFCLFDVPETPRTVGLSPHDGMITGAYTVFECTDPKLTRYFESFYLVMDDRKLLSPLYSGLRHTIPPARFLGTKTPQPPREEQTAIVRFLDHANGKLERAIQAKRKVIALLNEQKQAIIHRAVTRGLDLNVPLKTSGIPWLGDIPQHWEIKRNSWLFDERLERGRAGLPLLIVSLRTGVTEGSEIDDDGRPKRLIAKATGYKFAGRGDIAYNMMRMWQGAVGEVPMDGLVSPAYVVATPRNGVFSGYYERLFRTDGCKNEINRNSRGIVSDRNRLYWDQFKKLYLPQPPFEEQKAIVAHTESATRNLNTTIARLEREIALLREYRMRLMADVVTGKLDVRPAAVLLPAEAPSAISAPDDRPEPDDAELAEAAVEE